MKAPLSWLKDYVDIDCTPEILEEKLFSCGFEVEDKIYTAGKIDKIVTCKILEIEKHPNADKLSVTKVDVGAYGQLQIITAAKNIFVGAVVPVALDGATLYNGDRIFNGELRGLPSYGMFCSGEELGITDDWYEGASVNGILILDEKFPLGVEVKDLLDLNDVIFDINVTANRPDCQSILGIAREVAAVLNKPLKQPDFTFKCNDKYSTKDIVTINNKAFDLCSRYIGRVVKNIKIGPSPLWLKRRLFSMGIRSINNIVDITNFVLLEIGQPMHAFDLAKLSNNEINVRRASNNEKIITLDEKECILNENNLVICDAEKPVALAGVMGGLDSGISDQTIDVVFESATFKRDNIRKTSRLLGQKSDSSTRFEKGVDFYSVEYGMKRALNLIDTLGCGEIACDQYDLYEGEIVNKVIETTFTKVNGVLGLNIDNQTIVDILKRLYFEVESNGDELKVTVPLFREDMEGYPDIAEEIIREYGYSHITPTLLKKSSITNGGLNDKQNKQESFKNLLISYGFNEIITYSFVPEKDVETFKLPTSADSLIKILNPISEEMAVMRSSLIPSIVRAVSNNITRKNNEGRLFEIAKVYSANELPLKELPVETAMLSIAMFGNEDFFSVKGVIEGILNNFCFGKDVKYVKTNEKLMHPTRSADIIADGESIGFFGQLHPVIAEKFSIDKPLYVAELNYDVLSKHFAEKIIFKPISKFPSVERDLAVIINDNITCAEVVDIIKQAGGEFLESVKLFDVYKGEQIASDKKSLAFNLVFVSLDRTLNVEEIDNIVKNILAELRNKVNAELR